MAAVSSYRQLVCVLFLLKLNWECQTEVPEGKEEILGAQDDQTGAGGYRRY
jgi:hypothetical protein